MRAAVLAGQGDIRVVEKPVPTPGEGEVLIKVAMCGTCGSDISRVYRRGSERPPYGTFTPGHEWTGHRRRARAERGRARSRGPGRDPCPQGLRPLPELRAGDVHRLPELREPGPAATEPPA